MNDVERVEVADAVCNLREGGREGGRERGREGGRDGGREREREEG